MSRAVEIFAIALLVGAASAFVGGVHALGEHQDFKALYLLVVGASALKASTEILRPRSSA